jgi:pyrroline-5-carboxylate reductase
MTERFRTVAFIGVGTMAEAMADCALAAGWPRDRLLMTHRRAERREELEKRFGCKVDDDNVAAARRADIVVLAVRPQEFDEVLKTLRDGLRPGQMFISIAAGLTVEWLEPRVPRGITVVRVTPPPTAWIKAGVTLVSSAAKLSDADRLVVEQLVAKTCERVEWIPDALMEPITGVALGLTPYTCLFMRTLIETGIEQGIDPVFVRKMVIDGLWATARMLHDGGVTPEEVIDMVATREGLTWSALHTMEAHGVPKGIRAGARAMTGRSFELRGEPVPDDYKGFER